jgi:hypothetical protein
LAQRNFTQAAIHTCQSFLGIQRSALWNFQAVRFSNFNYFSGLDFVFWLFGQPSPQTHANDGANVARRRDA